MSAEIEIKNSETNNAQPEQVAPTTEASEMTKVKAEVPEIEIIGVEDKFKEPEDSPVETYTEKLPDPIFQVYELATAYLNKIFYMKTEDVIFHEGAYPREHWHQEVINKYVEAIKAGKQLPPIDVNRSGILVDGYHRLQAYIMLGIQYIPCLILETKSDSDADVKIASFKKNNAHGQNLSQKEMQNMAIEQYLMGLSYKEIVKIVPVSEKTIFNWTKDVREKQEAAELEVIKSMWYRCETHKAIAEAVGKLRGGKDVAQSTVSDKIKNFTENCKLAKSSEVYFADFDEEGSILQVFNRWDIDDISTISPEIIENLLNLLTEPTDIVFDPFSGSRTIIEVCKKRLRRFFMCAKDFESEDVRKHDITTGLPDGLITSKMSPNLIFLNPFDMGVDVTPEQIGKIAQELKDKLKDRFANLVFVTKLTGRFSEGNDMSLSYALALSKHFNYRYKIILSPSDIYEWGVNQERKHKDVIGCHREILIFQSGVKHGPKLEEDLEAPVEASEPVKEAPVETVPNVEEVPVPEPVPEPTQEAPVMPEPEKPAEKSLAQEMIGKSSKLAGKNGKNGNVKLTVARIKELYHEKRDYIFNYAQQKSKDYCFEVGFYTDGEVKVSDVTLKGDAVNWGDDKPDHTFSVGCTPNKKIEDVDNPFRRSLAQLKA